MKIWNKDLKIKITIPRREKDFIHSVHLIFTLTDGTFKSKKIYERKKRADE